jgi:hypothetical protein
MKDRVKEYINRYFKYHGKIPRMSVISKKMDIPKPQLVKVFRELETDGYLKRNYSQYKFVQDRDTQIEKEKKENKGYLDDNSVILITRIIMGLIGVWAIILSMNYISVWFGEHLQGFFQWLFSSVAVLFNVMSFEVTIVLWRNRQKLASLLFGLVWVIVFVFCILAVISGQYNKRTEKIDEKNNKNNSINIKNIEYISYNKEVQDYQDQLNPKKDRLKKLNDRFILLDPDENKKEYDKTDSDIRTLEKQIDDLEKKKKVSADKRSKLLKENESVEGLTEDPSNKETSYQKIGSAINMSAEDVEFWMSLLPATFLDIISAMSLAVALFLRKKEKREKISFFQRISELLKGENK